ncbi:hypothetical protein EDB82DRAFT_503547 [Fusarium venenatum]|uniref:uncharacterized protein n=1 Tax=Fusarium venenatum TaxID=56646 RepID=UPI001D78037A|nr:hypothetical protein EDB82DRAFT_503547 [Fusarium venenatum]
MRFIRCTGTVFLTLSWEACVCFFNHVALKSCITTILLHSKDMPGHCSHHSPHGHLPGTLSPDSGPCINLWIMPTTVPWISHFSGSVRPDMKTIIFTILAMCFLVSIGRFPI